MDTDHNAAKTRTNKTTTTVIIGIITLAMGLVVGVTAAESGIGIFGAKARDNNTATNDVSSSSLNNPRSASVDEWNPFQQIRDMQAQMDRMFSQMNEQFQGAASFHGFTDIPGYSLSLDVRDLKNRYEVHAYLPDAKASDVHVSLENSQTLKVEVDRQHAQKSSMTNMVSNVVELGQYTQEVQLPTPVKAAQMKITRNGHDLVITIPKAA
jgi:HSP20 family molecular chaperone IbpA